MVLVSSKTSVGTCPKVSNVKNFNADAYVGRWYEYRRDSDNIFELWGECVTATYGILSNGNVSVKNRLWLWYLFFSYYDITGEAKCNPTGSEGSCYVNFAPGEKDMTKESNYEILDTDYYNYAIVYNCVQNGPNKSDTMWILTRA